MKTVLDQAKIAARLDRCLDVEFTFLKTEEPARILAAQPPERQAYLLTWVERVASTNTQLAYQFISQAIAALEHMAPDVVEAWALHAMDIYDQAGLHKALAVIREVHDFVRQSHERRVGAVLEREAGVLLHFAHGLSGRQLKLDASDDGTAWTDSETLFLPPVEARLPSPADNFLLYKASVGLLWAQTRYGSFRVDLPGAAAATDDPDAFIARFHGLETLRLEARLRRELPGLYRDMRRLRQLAGEGELPGDYSSLYETLAAPGARAEDSLRLCLEHPGLPSLPPRSYQGSLRPEAVAERMAARIEREKALLRVKLSELLREQMQAGKEETAREDDTEQAPKRRFNLKQADSETLQFDLTLDDQPVPLPDGLRQVASSVLLDLGEIPDDYLTPAGEGEYDPALYGDEEEDAAEDVWSGTYHEQGAFLYDEWDYRRQSYRKNWCAVREVAITPHHDDFVAETRRKYHGHIKQLRKTFEAMRDEDRLLKRQSHGDGIDIDALVEALADARDGSELSERLFTRMHRVERNIAVAFLVDMSGSTRGWINQAERESLILLCEALESLGDRYAIYGFSGQARKRCEIYPIKTFEEPYDDAVRARISGIEAKDYTRMGFAIRHLGRLLNEVEARTRILITLSDGKPDDYDNYRGEYGIEDTRRALLEVRRDGIHPYCITIDQEARDYLPHLYGPAAFTVVEEVTQLPHKVSGIYRRLTT